MSKVREQVATAREILDKHREEIRSRWQITGTGVGHKIREGKITDEVAIIFYVKKKKSNEELSAEGKVPIPENFYGFPTDVQELELKKRI
jgi:hypothetical protein